MNIRFFFGGHTSVSFHSQANDFTPIVSQLFLFGHRHPGKLSAAADIIIPVGGAVGGAALTLGIELAFGNQAWCGWGRQLISFQMGFTTFNKQDLGLHQDQYSLICAGFE